MLENLNEEIKSKRAKVGVIGLGYVGLPLAVAFAEAGFRVIGFDVQQKRVDLVNQGISYIADIEPGRLKAMVVSGFLEATTTQSKLKGVAAICVCVPTPLTKTKDPDLSYVIRESEIISQNLRPGHLIILESTTYPGTTEEVVLPILEMSGLKGGIDFYLAYSPERVDPGNSKFNIKNTPKIVGGINSQSTEMAKLLYSQIVNRVVTVSSPKVAEMAKLVENVFRNVNIALVNELTQLCYRMGISIWEVIDAASTKPFGYMPFYPGPGVGGHCIPLDPYYLAHKAKEYDFHTRFIELAGEINESMPYHVVSRLMEILNARGKSLDGSKILLLGITYKKDVGDLRESPALKILSLLQNKGADVSYHDPYIKELPVSSKGLPVSSIEPLVSSTKLFSQELNENLLSTIDCVVITTDHSSYNYPWILEKSSLIFDTRGVTRSFRNDKTIFL